MFRDTTLSLYTIRTDHLIVLSATGMWYSNQTGGLLCAQPRAMGYLMPFDEFGMREEEADALVDHWVRLWDVRCPGTPEEKYQELAELSSSIVGPEGDYAEWLRLATLDEIEAQRHLFAEPAFGEAWLPVVITAHEECPELVGAFCILTWPNSD